MSNLTLDVHTADGSTNGTVELPSSVFDVEVSTPLLHQVVTAQLAARRARQGSIRAPQFTGGGTVYGPQPRDYDQRTPKKMKAAALRGALSDRARHDRIHVVEDLVPGQTPSTKAARTFIERLTDRKSVLVVLGREDVNSIKSARNLPNVHILPSDQLNTYDVLNSDDLVFSVEALNAFIERATGAETKEESK